jgi:hypothetical protein
MNGHLPLELLSAYLDGEANPQEARRIASHLGSCVHCRLRLEGARRVVAGLRRVPPVEAPGALAVRVRERVAAERAAAAAGSWKAILRSWYPRWLALPPSAPSRSAFSAPLGAALALLVMLLLAEHGSLPGPVAGDFTAASTSGGVGNTGSVGNVGNVGSVGDNAHARPEFLVSEAFGDAPTVLPQTTSEVAGRVFVLSDDVWVQRGVDASDARGPRARVQARSPQGRALLAQLTDLGVLLADGSRVVLRYKLETLELSDGS